MKPFYLIAIVFILSGCSSNTIEITGTTKGMDGGVITITGLSGKTYFTEIIKSGGFTINKQTLPAYGYFTLSVLAGDISHDYEIYLEAGKYAIDIPQKDGQYLSIKTDSKIQNNLSAYYNLENSVADKFRREDAMWNARLREPKTQSLPEAEFNVIMDHIAAGKKREHGLTIATIDMFIKKYPQNDIVPHIIGNLDFAKDPEPYYLLYKKLSPQAQNSEEGKQLGQQLHKLVKNQQALN